MVQFRMLGALSLVGSSGRELREVLVQPKRVALLAYLVAAESRGFHRRDSLLPLFWPELDQDHARSALRQALHGLRRSLGAGAIESRGDDEIRVDEQYLHSDVRAFNEAADARRYNEALALYRGDLLDGFFISGAPEFERWLEDERARLRRRACESAWAHATLLRSSGDHALAVHWARHAAALSRDDEGAIRRLITFLDEEGDRAGALQVYENFARRLASEYEAEPAAETVALIAAVRSRVGVAIATPEPDPALPTLPPVPEVDVTAPPPVAVGPSLSPRIGRRRVLWIGAALLLCSAAVLSVTALQRAHQADDLSPQRVVVAAFSNRTGDPTLDAIGELAADEIMRGLELTEVVEVAHRGALSRYAGARSSLDVRAEQESASVHQLALATRSGIAVWGAYYGRADSLQFAARLVDERKGKVLRSLELVRGDAHDPRRALMVLRDRIMAVVAEAADPRLAPSASRSGDPPLYEAYLAFSTGVGLWYDARNGRDALPHFKRSATLDTTFALPLIWAAWIHQTLNECDSTQAIARRLVLRRLSSLEKTQMDRQLARCRGDLPTAYDLARTLVDKRPTSEVWQEQLARDALNFNRPRETVAILEQLHPEVGGLRARASYYNWLTNAYHLLGEHQREREAAERARRHFPATLATLRMELLALGAQGRGREVIERFDEIDALPPDPIRKKPTVMREIALDLAAHSDAGAARLALDRTLTWHASRPPAEQATDFNRFERAQSYYARGDADSARAIMEDLARANPRSEPYLGLLGTLAAQRGDDVQALSMDRLLAALDQPNARGQSPYWRACIAARRGHPEEAIDFLRRALAQGYVFNGLFFLSAHVEPSFAPLRELPRFQQVLRPRE